MGRWVRMTGGRLGQGAGGGMVEGGFWGVAMTGSGVRVTMAQRVTMSDCE